MGGEILQRLDLENRVIVITGASSGIGRATATVAGASGAHLLLVGRDEAALSTLQGEIRKDGGTAEIMVADMRDKTQVLATIDQAESRLGPVDGYFANAGAGGPKVPLAEYGDEDFEAMLTLNLRSPFWAIRHLLPKMIERRTGAILVTGSLGSERGLPLTSGYNIAKHGVLGLVRSAAVEVAKYNVRINAVIPGLIETRMLDELAGQLGAGDASAGRIILGGAVPMGRVGRAEELGNVAAFLLSGGSSYVSGQAWAVDGGILNVFGAQ